MSSIYGRARQKNLTNGSSCHCDIDINVLDEHTVRQKNSTHVLSRSDLLEQTQALLGKY